ncbi:unnamed protein product, partial [Ixodes persulcatus]
MMLWRIILALLLTVPRSALAVCSSGPIVSTTTGKVCGFRRVLLGDRGVDCFTESRTARRPWASRGSGGQSPRSLGTTHWMPRGWPRPACRLLPLTRRSSYFKIRSLVRGRCE